MRFSFQIFELYFSFYFLKFLTHIVRHNKSQENKIGNKTKQSNYTSRKQVTGFSPQPLSGLLQVFLQTLFFLLLFYESSFKSHLYSTAAPIFTNLAIFFSWPSTKSQRDFLIPWYSFMRSQSAFSIALKTPPYVMILNLRVR